MYLTHSKSINLRTLNIKKNSSMSTVTMHCALNEKCGRSGTFPLVLLIARPFYSCVLNGSEAAGDLALIQTFLLLPCKYT